MEKERSLQLQKGIKNIIYKHLPDHKKKARDHVDGSHSENIPEQKKECSSTSFAKRVAVDGGQDICVLVQKLHALLQAPEATRDDADDVLRNFISRFFGFPLQICQHGSDRFDDRDNQ